MVGQRNRRLDDIDASLLSALDVNARLSLSDLAGQVGLTAPSVAERLRRLESSGLLRAYSIDLDLRELGYAVRAWVRVRPLPGKLHVVEPLLQDAPNIVECDKITGDDAFLARVVARSVEQLDEILEHLSAHAVTSTAVIKGSPIPPRLPPLR